MRMKLIASLLVLCLTFSIGSALAQTTSSPNTFPNGVIILNGNVTGNYTISGPGSVEKNVTGFVLIIKDLNKNAEKVQIWDEEARTILFTGNGTLTPIKINKPLTFTSQNNASEQAGLFAVGDLEDFKCNMTNLNVSGHQANVKLTGPEMKVFGGAGDVSNFLFQSSDENASECSLTYRTLFSPVYFQ